MKPAQAQLMFSYCSSPIHVLIIFSLSLLEHVISTTTKNTNLSYSVFKITMRRSCSPSSSHLNKVQYSRKRQREQTAAIIVQEYLWSQRYNLGRKSTAQPRPVLHVPPHGIGPTIDPNVNDVLCGRGGRVNSHAGNIQFRVIIASLKKEYLAKTTKKLEKAHIASKIINTIRSLEPPGRFLKEDDDTGLWFDIGDAKAIKKAGQALREDAAGIRHETDGDMHSLKVITPSEDKQESKEAVAKKAETPNCVP